MISGRFFRHVEKRVPTKEYLRRWCLYIAYFPFFICGLIKPYWRERPKRMQMVMEQCSEEDSQFQEHIFETPSFSISDIKVQ